MTDVLPSAAEKLCPACGETKNLSDFHRNKTSKDGHAGRCKPCNIESVKASQKRRREEIGEQAYLAERREATSRSREKPDVRKRQYQINEAIRDAMALLRDRHRAEYEHLLELAKRGELPTE